MYILPQSLYWNCDETQNHDHKKAQCPEELDLSFSECSSANSMNSYFFCIEEDLKDSQNT